MVFGCTIRNHLHSNSTWYIALVDYQLVQDYHSDPTQFIVLKQAVQHSDGVQTYTPTYWPDDNIHAGHIDASIKFYRNQCALRLTKVAAQLADHILLQSAAQCSAQRVPMKPASHFSGCLVRWISS